MRISDWSSDVCSSDLYTIAFRKRLEGSAMPVDHSTAGAKEVRNLATGGLDRGVAELIAYAIAGHHAGLPDGIGGAGSLEERLKNPIEPLDPVWREEIVPDATGDRKSTRLNSSH